MICRTLPAALPMLALAGLVAACAGSGPPPAAPTPAGDRSVEPPAGSADARELRLPGSWSGELPCADCPGQRITLTLFADGSYRLRRVYVGADAGRDRVSYERGRWAREAGADELALTDGADVQSRWRVLSSQRLRLLDRDGRDIDSTLNYEIARTAELDRIAGPMPVRGLYRYFADAASLADCASGVTYPVLIEAEHITLERAWLAARSDAGSARVVDIEAEFVLREPEPGLPPRESLRVTRFVALGESMGCDEPAATAASLAGTLWRAVEIDGAAVTGVPLERTPTLRLDAAERRAGGDTGCNRYTGAFEQQGEALRFGALAATRRACIGPGADLEPRFVAALESVRSQRLRAGRLELLDEAGRVRLRFEAPKE